MSELIITVYYDDSAKYFYSFEDDFIRENLRIIYLCHNLSAYFFLKFKSSQKCLYVNNWRTRLDYLKFRFFYSHEDISLPLYIQKIIANPREHQNWASEYRSHTNFIDRELSLYDFAILSGEDRSLEWILSRHVRKKIFFEQGPFNTTTLSTSGVNANLRPDKRLPTFFTERKVDIKEYFERRKSNKRLPIYRIIDFLNFLILFMFGICLPSEKIEISSFSNKLKNIFKFSNKRNLASSDLKEKNVLLVLQIHSDVNNIIHAPDYNLSEVLFQILQGVKTSKNLRARLHPLESTRYARIQKKVIEDYGVELSEYTLAEDLAWSKVVITANSTVGIEAIRKGLPVICYGNSYWETLPNVLKVKKIEDISILVGSLLANPDRRSGQVESMVLENFLRDRFVPGHFRHHVFYKNAVSNWLVYLLQKEDET